MVRRVWTAAESGGRPLGARLSNAGSTKALGLPLTRLWRGLSPRLSKAGPTALALTRGLWRSAGSVWRGLWRGLRAGSMADRARSRLHRRTARLIKKPKPDKRYFISIGWPGRRDIVRCVPLLTTGVPLLIQTYITASRKGTIQPAGLGAPCPSDHGGSPSFCSTACVARRSLPSKSVLLSTRT